MNTNREEDRDADRDTGDEADRGGRAADARLTRDLRKAAESMELEEVRYLVDTYYQLQKTRIAAAAMARSLAESGEPSGVSAWLSEQARVMEQQIKGALDRYSAADDLGAWARSQVGVGPVLAAGLLAHVDVERARTAGAVWRFAGLAPPQTYEWGKGQKRPWNARLKVLCWKLGDSFVKLSGRDDCYYGRVYRERKALEVERNDLGAFAEEAARTLEKKKIRDKATRATYEAGRLPDGRIDLRARRYAVKLFAAHYWETGRRLKGLDVPLPYPVAHMGHAHVIAPPTRDDSGR